MMLYKPSKFSINIFPNFSSRITPPKNPIQESIFSRTISARFLRRQSSLNHGFLKQNKVNPFLKNGSKRFCCVDKGQVSRSSFRGFKEWLDPLYEVFGRETIPYTKRNHFLLFSRSVENKFYEILFNHMKETELDGKILPATHPESVRIRLIANDIIGALQKGLNKENVCSDIGYASPSDGSENSGGEGSLKASSKADEMLDDQWVQQSRKKGNEKGAVDRTGHLDGLNWEVLVVDEPEVNAFCTPGGKIVLFKGMLEHLKSDAEIATVIGHEVAHVVARHGAEKLTMISYTIMLLVLAQIFTSGVVVASTVICALSLCLHFLRRNEMEADHIGMLLIASAGYDPQVAPTVYAKLDELDYDTGGELPLWVYYLFAHPSGKTESSSVRRG